MKRLPQARTIVSSVRVRLILWNVGVLALVLIVLGGLLRERVQASLMDGLDQELAARARPLAARWDPVRWRERMNRRHRDREHDYDPKKPAKATASVKSTAIKPVVNKQAADKQTVAEKPIDASQGLPPSPPPPPGGKTDASQETDGIHLRILDAQERIYLTGEQDQALDPVALKQCLHTKAPVFSSVIASDGPERVYTMLLDGEPGKGPAILQTTAALTPVYKDMKRLSHTLLALAPLALLVTALGGAFLTDRALRPVRAVTRAASRTQAADLSARLEVRGSDEFSELANTFNAMLARLEEAFTRLERAYEQQRRFVADASHELKTPLTVIKANTSLALSMDDLSPADYRESLDAIDRAVDRTNRIVQDLFLLARSDGGQIPMDRKKVMVAEVFEDVTHDGRLLYPGGAPVTVDAPESLSINADPHLIHRLFANLLENALRHTPPQGSVTLSARGTASEVVMQVIDTGEGISSEHLPFVIDRFYRADAARARTNGSGEGTGLGLAICQAIAEAHGGTLSLKSEIGRGTTVRVSLPKSA